MDAPGRLKMKRHDTGGIGSLSKLLERTGVAVPLPSTAADYTPIPRESVSQRKARRLKEEGAHVTSCPECGERATQETFMVHRPGLESVERTLIRCWREPRYGRSKCPVILIKETAIGSEDAFTELAINLRGEPPQKEEIMVPTEDKRTKPCLDCGETIVDSHGRKRCTECNRKFETERKRLAWRRTYNEQHGIPVPEEARRLRDARGGRPGKSKQGPVTPISQDSVPPADPIIDPDDEESEVDFAGLVIDVLGLSLNKRNLLRALLEEVEP